MTSPTARWSSSRRLLPSRPDGKDVRDWDQRIARMVVGGELDMAFLPSRAWDTEGVGTLRPLAAPMLVTSQALVAEVVRSELNAQMLAGLDAVDVTGLALIPENLRHVFSFGEPLASPAAFAGTTIRVPHSDTTWAVFPFVGRHT